LGHRLSSEDLRTLYWLYVAMSGYFGLLAFELPFVQATVSFKRPWRVVRTAMVFLGLFLVLGVILVRHAGICGLPVALGLSQLYNTTSYVLFVRNHFTEVEKWAAVQRVAVSNL